MQQIKAELYRTRTFEADNAKANQTIQQEWTDRQITLNYFMFLPLRFKVSHK